MKIKSLHVASILAIALSFTFGIYGQAKPPAAATDKNKTDLETFQEKYGTVVIQGYTRLPSIRSGMTGSFSVLVKEFRSPASNLKTKGLVVEIDDGERYSSTARSFVEYAEIDSLLKGIEYISKIDKAVTSLDQFEAQYKTKDDFSVTVFSTRENKLSVSLRVGSIGSKSVFLDVSKLPEVVALFESAKAKLDALP